MKIPPPIPKRLIFPKPILAQIISNAKAKMEAKLGDNEIQIFDIGERGHRVWAWNFTNGFIIKTSGPLAGILKILQGVTPKVRTGFGILKTEGTGKGFEFSTMRLGQDRSVESAIVDWNGKPARLPEVVSNVYGIPQWKPHGVMGGPIIENKGQSYQPFFVNCMVSSRHLIHPEFMMETDKLGGSFILFGQIHYFIPAIPSQESISFLSTFDMQLMSMGARTINILMHPKEGNRVELAAWTLTDRLDPQEIARIGEQFHTMAMARFGKTTDQYSYPAEVVQFRVQQWITIFENEINRKFVVQVPIEDESGKPITEFQI